MDDSLSLAHLGLSLLAGSLTTLSPCVFPLLPLVVGGALQANRLAPLAMGMGMALTFALIGLLLGAAGPALGIDGDSIRFFGALLLILLATVLLLPRLEEYFSHWLLPLANSANSLSARLDGRSLQGALLLGAVLGLVWSPCSGPLLASALTLVASEGGAARGALLLGLFGVGAATPLVAVAYASRKGLGRARGWLVARIGWMKKLFGLLLGLAGLAILSGGDKWLEARVLRLLPEAWIRLTVLF